MPLAQTNGELHWIGGKPSVLIFDVNETLIDIDSMKPPSSASSAMSASCGSGSGN